MSPELKLELNNIREEFVISNKKLLEISKDFFSDMTNKKMLRMLRTFVSLDTDKRIVDEYLTIDLGGSNIRIAKIKIVQDDVQIEKLIKIPLRSPFKDYTSNKYTLKDLFEMALKKMQPFLEDKSYMLGVTISFGLESLAKNKAKIIELSKGFQLRETLGEDIYQILMESINELEMNIIPTVVINDCVATLVTGNFYNPNADIGIIVGTGHNACFIDKNNEIINIESANFNYKVPLTRFDNEYLGSIPREAENLFEVLIGGKYICGIANCIFKYLLDNQFIKEYKEVTTEDLVRILNKENMLKYSTEQKEIMEEIGEILFERSAKLIISEINAILMRIDKKIKNKHTIIFDGTVYEKCDFFRNKINEGIEDFFMDNSMNLSHKLLKDASSIGPAIVIASSK